MFNIILFEPEIPPNTGNIMRLAANTGCRLHLIKPYGFSLDDKQVRRAGLDYKELATIVEHNNLEACLATLNPERVFAITTKGATTVHGTAFYDEDVFIFGPETRGLPNELLGLMSHDKKLRIPMLPNSRSLNLANAVSIVVYEAWRQLGFTNSRS